ncbi:hypothetical protein B5M47_01790 [candidate division CPR3 bacterium 4484_211]|uniref:Rod shape-determining protein RodA n=1 Tax=candidate division CPR3 bacterium 4484_211 TaxID=1968527 RepID=A0A1W9NYC4_UNCC3|nr:MAG: hypothetical protein B5M47_01790 [candidate division CPR3 bacterium 4484_211]
MHRLLRDYQHRVGYFDFWLILFVGGLVVIGLLTLQSIHLAGGEYSSNIVNRQILALIIGIAFLVIFSSLDYHLLAFIFPFFYLVSIGLLGSVLLFVEPVRGARRWLEAGGYQIQPSEIVKPLLILFFAFFLPWGRKRWGDRKVTVISLGLILPVLALIFFEPDLGSALLMLAIWLFLIWFGVADLRVLLFFLILSLILVPFVYQKLDVYQRTRLLSFFEPGSDPLGGGYNAIQSVIAVGSGQVWGRHWGMGTQSHLRFLPDRHTDFIFATFCEEQGFAGGLFVLFVFGLFFWRLANILIKIADPAGRIIVGGILGMFFCQFGVNVGMNIGLLPITGVPLPFVSYGGSSLVISLASIGLVESVVRNKASVI